MCSFLYFSVSFFPVQSKTGALEGPEVDGFVKDMMGLVRVRRCANVLSDIQILECHLPTIYICMYVPNIVDNIPFPFPAHIGLSIEYLPKSSLLEIDTIPVFSLMANSG